MNLKSASKNALVQCLRVKQNEEILIVTDWERFAIGKAIYDEAKKLGAEPMLKIMEPREHHGQEPPKTVAKAMRQADVVIAPTSKSLTHTEATRNACKNKTRIASMPTITEEIFIRGMQADYDEIKKITNKIAKRMTRAKEARITTPSGTDLFMKIPTKPEADFGHIHKKGQRSNLPDGEVCLAPKEGSTMGVFVIDRFGNMITKPTKIEVENGMVKKIESTTGGKKLAKYLKEISQKERNKNAYNIAELGIGTNPTAKVTGCVLEDEKVLGTAHIALGDNTSYTGGKTPCLIHEDTILFKPTIEFDGETVMKLGKMLI
ncbi:MAG: hypothetical protein ACD_77C00032G0003 [uncultured bacterium]|nr:MAG: hypothetical protein ACD_77C00032G0003 [uncultured bacterium]